MLSRRAVLTGAAGLATASVLAGCSSGAGSGAAPSGQGSSGQTFEWTDARGKKISLDAAPAVVVAQSSAAAALWDAGFQVKGAYGELATTNGKLDYQAGNLDLSKITVIGKTYGEFAVEKLASMASQLLIDMSFDNKTLWYVDAKVEKQVTNLCPTLGMQMLGRDLVQVITSFADLAVKLGADPAVSAGAKKDFDAESATLRQAITAGSGAKIVAMSFDSDKAYIANAAQHPDLAYVKSLGAQFVDPKSKPEEYFRTISYEQLDAYDADVVIVDARNTYIGYKNLPTWKSLSAVKAKKVFAWKPAAPYSYLSGTSIMKDFAQVFASVAS